MSYNSPKDNREFIARLKESKDLITVDQEVDWDLELGAIVRRVCENQLPAPHFKKITDYPGFEAFGGPLSTYRRLAVAMGMSPDSSIPEIADEYVRRTKETPIDPVMVDAKDAPCKQNILVGDDANLFHLPGPMVHEGDGGRYLATWHFVVAKDPDTREINWGMYRIMVFDEKTMVGPVLPFSDMGKMFHGKHVPRNEPMPFAVVLAADPLSSIASCAPSPIPEDQLAGMLRGEPVELVKCETCDLEVPAHAEIIIEGEIIPNVSILEAPFGEYTGYRTSPRDGRTVYRIKAITHRNNPIIMVSNPGIPTDENQLLRSFSLGLEMRKLLESQGIPITGVFMLPESTHHLVVVGVKPAYTGIARQIANLAFGSKLGPWFHMLVVVDDKTDIYSKDEVIHALSTKCHPIRGIHKYENDVGTPLNPYASPEERKMSVGAKVLFDCLFPLDWPTSDLPLKVAFATNYPKEIQEKVLNNWENYGYDK
ncbi:PpcA2: phenylphosphate carboxylase, alpha subunit [Desulfosarcina variabilis str. Montpellier]|uniref:phenylphosphate carboxylase subunit alpha n=1 Tax=Desulfosarcina variabilis TaxID=2300 RepID=UPI003AFA31B8